MFTVWDVLQMKGKLGSLKGKKKPTKKGKRTEKDMEKVNGGGIKKKSGENEYVFVQGIGLFRVREASCMPLLLRRSQVLGPLSSRLGQFQLGPNFIHSASKIGLEHVMNCACRVHGTYVNATSTRTLP
ncbi:hypothetical protein PoB_001222300 [Plakobranchus ocellatus]|uniref:Uncharacterized protein n=1 Tax=Plakobranchus ocellatus TaxID=259542 RepID=A0AAV3YU01_9GAST|nr:hypothetical protein PoB_001222300 [Plakobranchus ocellatus]